MQNQPNKADVATLPVLKPDYYRDNFLQMTAWALGKYRHFFDLSEQAVFDAVTAAPAKVQALYIRMINRRGNLFFGSSLQYSELGDVAPLSACLEELGLVYRGPDAVAQSEAQELLNHLTVAQLRELGRRHGIAVVGRKGDWVDALAEAWDRAQLARDLVADFDWIAVRHKPLFERLMTCFFCSRHGDMSQFVIADLGHVTYEGYIIDPETPFFRSRDHLEQYLTWGTFKDQFYLAQQAKDYDALKSYYQQLWEAYQPDQPWSGTIFKMLVRAVKAWEAEGNWAAACDRYQQLLGLRFHFEAASRWVHCSEKQGLYTQALAQATAWYQQSRLPSAKLFFGFHINKNQRALKQPKTPQLKLKKPPVIVLEARKADTNIGSKAGYYPDRPDSQNLQEPITVEAWVLEHYSRLGYRGCWAENGYVRTLCCLLGWDIVFAPVPGVFQHPFQLGPMDLNASQFLERRRQHYQVGLRQLEAMDKAQLQSTFRQRYEAKQTVACSLNSAPFYPLEVYDALFQASSVKQIIALFRSFWESWPETRRGFPDIAVWNDNSIQFIEVKGKGDTLSNPQKIWHHLLIESGYQVHVGKVNS